MSNVFEIALIKILLSLFSSKKIIISNKNNKKTNSIKYKSVKTHSKIMKIYFVLAQIVSQKKNQRNVYSCLGGIIKFV